MASGGPDAAGCERRVEGDGGKELEGDDADDDGGGVAGADVVRVAEAVGDLFGE